MNQFYESQVYDIYVIRGNAAIFKCHIPSFVSDNVQVVSWHDTEGGEYIFNEHYGTYNRCLECIKHLDCPVLLFNPNIFL